MDRRERSNVDVRTAPNPPVSWQGLLGYLNFSDGRPDARFQQQWHAACQMVAGSNDLSGDLAVILRAELKTLHDSGSAAFRDVSQAEFTIHAALTAMPAAYLEFQKELLGHHQPANLITPFFLIRIVESVLQQRKASSAETVTPEFIADAVARLNDYVGYRPVPVLETRAAIDFYPHEKIRPVPLYIKGVGVAAGPYHDIVLNALKVLSEAPTDLLEEAHLDLDALEEIAFDPRAYDHNHPANRRPNYVFGEWDPHHIDNKGRFSRFVVRQTILDLLLRRIAERTLELKLDPKTKNYVAEFSVPWDNSERIYESAAVLAGTTLMATMLCGGAPTAHDSASTLSNLVPRIAKLRDEFYQRLIDALKGPHADKLRADATKTRQPFGGVRQALNQSLAQDRAGHLQERQLAVLFAILGFSEEARARANKVAAPGVRFVIEARVRLTEIVHAAEQGDFEKAMRLLTETVDVVKRGIDCGALVDPWNVLGFQGLFPLFQAREDSVHDPRVEELLLIMDDLFDGYAAVIMESAARGEPNVRKQALHEVRQLAEWWDRFATYEVSDVKRVYGADAVESADHVADALARWRKAGGSATVAGPSGSVNFWREHLEGFKTPAAFGRVVAALLDRGDFSASMALLMTWLSQTPTMTLGEGELSFHTLAKKWVRHVGRLVEEPTKMLSRFFELLEANADAYWFVPDLENFGVRTESELDDTFEAAYEGVTFRDSADDGSEGALIGDESEREPFSLDEQAEPMRQRIEFLRTVADLLYEVGGIASGKTSQTLRKLATERAKQLEALLEPLHEVPLPAPDTASFESSVEYDRRREIKETLIEEAIAAAVAFRQSSRALGGGASTSGKTMFAWESAAAALDQEIRRGDPEAVRNRLRTFIQAFSDEPLLYIPVGAGGHPRQVLRARAAQGIIHSLLDRLPRLGLFRETFTLTQLARKMEQNAPPEGRRVTEFDRLFPIGLKASIETLLNAIEAEATPPDGPRIQEMLNALTGPYLKLWLKHSQTLRLSILETVQSASEWLQVEKFVERFGRELFTAQTLNFANLRAILHRGIEDWLDQLAQQSHGPEDFLSALDRDISRAQAAHLLEVILQAVAENYDEYRDYNTTTTQSDYGNNLYYLLDFLRLKVAYDRDGWRLRPLLLTHEVLCRRGRTEDAARWQELISVYTKTQSEQHLQELNRLETKHVIRLRTIRERLEERFVAGLAQDRLAALLPPLWQAARQRQPDATARFQTFKTALEPFTANPVGAGLETPGWIRRLEREMAHLRGEEMQPPFVPPVQPTLGQLRKQLTGDWEDRLELP